MAKARATATACPECGSTSPRAMRDDGRCVNAKGCNERRCARRKSEDDAVSGPRTQCHATRGSPTSITFCRLREGHVGLHLAGSIEWGGDYEAPAAKMFRAALAARGGAS